MDVIYLRSTNNLQGGHKLMDLSTRILITLPNIYPRFMTKIFIKDIEKLAESQGFKTLKKSQEEGDYFPGADLLAGVDWLHNYNEKYYIQEG